MQAQPVEDAPIIIVGGGITGLAAAWALQQAGQPFIVLEAGERWGGKIITTYLDTPAGDETFILEGGPESFVTRKPAVWQLAQDLNITQEIIGARNEARHIYILTDGKPLELPLHPLKFIGSRLLSWRGKVRLLAEPFIGARRDEGDESIASFVTRRLGAEAHERLIGPILGGIYNTDTTQQSILVSSPVMREMEREHGGLIRGALARMRRKKTAPATDDKPPASFITFAKGAQTLVDALVNQLDGDLRLNTRVADVVRHHDGHYEVVLADGERLNARAVIFATPANVTAPIIRDIAPEASTELTQIPHNSLGTIALIYQSKDLEGVLSFSGVMIPRREKRRIDAVTWTSRKDRERTPAGYDVLRVFYGGGDPDTATMSEAALLAVVQGELRALLGIDATPIRYVVTRWHGDYAQAPVGHLVRVARIEATLPDGLFVTGSSYRGLAVPDCIQQAQATVAQLLAQQANLPTYVV